MTRKPHPRHEETDDWIVVAEAQYDSPFERIQPWIYGPFESEAEAEAAAADYNHTSRNWHATVHRLMTVEMMMSDLSEFRDLDD